MPWAEYSVTVVIELYRVNFSGCGVRREKVEQRPSKAPFSKRFEEAVGQAYESAPVRRVAHQFHLPERTVRAIDVRYLQFLGHAEPETLSKVIVAPERVCHRI